MNDGTHFSDMPGTAPAQLTAVTIGHYEREAEAYREGTWNHDVSQNRAALLAAMVGEPPFHILDFGCGPGRDLVYFSALGHRITGLDGSAAFVEMARTRSGCEVLHQDFIALDLPAGCFNGVFANASLFHVPRAGARSAPRQPATGRSAVLLQPPRRKPGRLQRQPLRHLLQPRVLAHAPECRRLRGT
jgi:SAM-dependent methyltransferase